MSHRQVVRCLLILFLGPLQAAAESTAEAEPPCRVLLVLESGTGAHEASVRQGGRPSVVEDALGELARSRRLEIGGTAEAASAVTPASLERFRAVIVVGRPRLPGESGKALLAWVEGGGAAVLIHAGCRGSAVAAGEDLPAALAGGAPGRDLFEGDAGITIHDMRHPAALPLRPYWKLRDTLPSMPSFDAAGSRVLLSLDMTSIDPPGRKPVHVPVAWTRILGKGRVFCTMAGHRPETWRDPAFREHVIGGLEWALGRRKAESEPNPEIPVEMRKLAEKLCAPLDSRTLRKNP